MKTENLPLEKEMSRLDSIISGKYLGDSSPVPREQLHVAYMWLENDIASSILTANDMEAAKNDISQLISKSWASEIINNIVSIEDAYKQATIRKDFAAAFRTVKKGTALSKILDWSFSDKDLIELAKLHKANRFRKKIESLLEDCNFHYECGLMANGNYSEWL